MATKSFIRFYGGVNVQKVKVDTVTSNTLAMSRNDQGKWNSDFVIASAFSAGTEVDADYYSPGINEGVKSMTFYKKTPNQKYYDLVTGANVSMFVMDYNVRNYEYYHYMVAITQYSFTQNRDITTIFENKLSEKTGKPSAYGTIPSYERAFWDAWSICDIEQSTEDENTYLKTGDIWRLKYNISEESITQNLNVTVWDTLSKYSKISLGQRDYMSSTFTGLLGDMEYFVDYNSQEDMLKINSKSKINVCQYTERLDPDLNPYSTEMDKLKKWVQFCGNGKLKLLKDQKGNAWVVQITGMPNNNIDIKSNLQETVISFDWQEVLDVSKICIIRKSPVEKGVSYGYSEMAAGR